MDASSDDPEDRFGRAIVHAVLRSVVHDLNNPLGTITTAAAALRSTDDAAQHAELINLIEREAMRAGSTARAAAERTTVVAAPVPTTVQGLVEAVRDRCRSAGVDATIVLDEVAETMLGADPTLLPQALSAFVVDAHGSPGRDEPVQVEVRVADDALEVSIRDDGDPVTRDRAGRPFRPFDDDEGATRAVGFPVAAGRAHVRRLGGQVELLPGTERGNTVRLRLPLAAVPAPHPSRAAAADGDEPSRRVLVVDDDRTMRDMLEVVLRREGWDTTAAADGPTAAALVGEQPVDLVLLDLHVGAEHGPDIAALLEQQRPGLSRRVVYLSGDVPPSGRIDGRPAITKPFVLDELYRVADAIASDEGPL
ncbi:MAG: response regulator [Egicoccus sp.]